MSIRISTKKQDFLLGGIGAAIAFLLCAMVSGSVTYGVYFAVAFFLVNIIHIQIDHMALNWAVSVLIAVFSAVLNFILVQWCMDLLPEFASIGSGGKTRYVLNLLCYLLILFAVYGLIPNVKISSLITFFTTLLLATINYYVVAFRGSEMKPADIFSIQAALNVVDSYTFYLPSCILHSWMAAAVWHVLLFRSIHIKRQPSGVWVRLAVFLASIGCALTIVGNPEYISPDQWINSGSLKNGFLLNYFTQIEKLAKPYGYDSFPLDETASQYASVSETQNIPNVIVIMNEAFADLDVYGGTFRTSHPVTPFFDSLSENTIRGTALSSIFGGGTPNSEYEFLTGNTLAFLPSGSIPYQQYVQEGSYSLNRYMKTLGYHTIAMHPHWKNGWMRSTVWNRLQFDETYFRDDGFFSEEETNRGAWISDMEMYQKILELIEIKSNDAPLFLFGVTVQNHGGYTDSGYPSTVSLSDYPNGYPEAEQYLTLLQESDTALEYLLTHLKALDEDVIVLFYGDHQAKLGGTLYEDLNGASFEDLQSQQRRYMVPFLIWANYDIPESTVELTSLNYLSSHLLEAAEIPLPPYNQFLKSVEEVIPAINANGYYSISAGQFLPCKNASGQEKEVLEAYQILQYNSIKGRANRNNVFFP